jgi:ankyrin repeat protein
MNKEEANQKMIEIMNEDDLLSKKEIQLFKELMVQCDLTIQDKNWKNTPLMFVFSNNIDKNLHLTQKQLSYLIQNSNLTQQDKDGWTSLIFALYFNDNQNLHLTTEQWDYLIQNSDLQQQDKDGWTPFTYALFFNQSQNLDLTKEQFQTMYDALMEEQQQSTFQKFIHDLRKTSSFRSELKPRQKRFIY